MKFLRSPGFTLLEIIATLVVVGILATMAVPFFKTGVTSTHVVLNQLGTDTALQQALENMIQDYNNSSTMTLLTLQSNIGAQGATATTYAASGNSYYVKTSTCAELSGTTFTTQSCTTSSSYLLVTITPSSSNNSGLTYLFAKKSS